MKISAIFLQFLTKILKRLTSKLKNKLTCPLSCRTISDCCLLAFVIVVYEASSTSLILASSSRWLAAKALWNSQHYTNNLSYWKNNFKNSNKMFNNRNLSKRFKKTKVLSAFFTSTLTWSFFIFDTWSISSSSPSPLLLYNNAESLCYKRNKIELFEMPILAFMCRHKWKNTSFQNV